MWQRSTGRRRTGLGGATYASGMTRLRALVLAPLALAVVGVVPSTAQAATLPPLPEGYQNFVPEIDYAALMGNAVTGSGNLACSVTESNIAAFGVGSTFNPSQIQQDLVKGVQFVTALNDATKEGVASCTVDVTIPAGVRSITGGITNEALVTLTGASAGTFALDCEMATSVSATATVRFGGKVPGKVDVVVTRANKPIPFNCAIAITFGASTLNGTVKGAAEIADPTVVARCDGSSTISCAPLQLTDAKVVITSSTGKFGGRTGEGTYSFVDSFSLPFVESQLAGIPGIAKSSVRRTSVNRSLVGLTPPATSERMTLTLNKSTSKTAILRPIGTTIASGGAIAVAGTAKAACTLTAKVGKKSARIASFTLNSSGRTSARALSAKVAKSIGAKKNGKVTLTASCRGTNKKTSVATRTVTYLG